MFNFILMDNAFDLGLAQLLVHILAVLNSKRNDTIYMN